MSVLEDVKNFIIKFNNAKPDDLVEITKILVNLSEHKNQAIIFTADEIKNMAEIIQDFADVNVTRGIVLDNLKETTAKFISEVQALNYRELDSLSFVVNRFHNTTAMLLMKENAAPALRRELLMFSNLNYFVETCRIALFDKERISQYQPLLSSSKSVVVKHAPKPKISYEQLERNYNDVCKENEELREKIKKLEAEMREIRVVNVITNRK